MRGALPNGLHPWLHAKSLDAAIKQVPVPYCPAAAMVGDFELNKKTLTKPNFY
jgi:hypothetical protein